MQDRRNVVGFVDSLVLALVSSVYLGLIFPLQSYLPNTDSFGFSTSDILVFCGVRTITLAAILLVVSHFTRQRGLKCPRK